MRKLVLSFCICFAWITFTLGQVYGAELRVGGLPLEGALVLPTRPGPEKFNATLTIYIGDLPKEAVQFDVRAAYGRLDFGEIGAYLAALISGKPVTGTAKMHQTLLLLHYAADGGGQTGPSGDYIKDVYYSIKDAVDNSPSRNTVLF